MMALCGPVLVPLRLCGALATLSLGWMWAHVALLGSGMDDPSAKPYAPLRHKGVFAGFGALSRCLLFCYGYVWIRVIDHAADDDTENNTSTREQEKPRIVVCNHSGFVELLYLAYSDGCSFVSKADNKSLPFMGWMSQAMQCIFVERHNAGAGSTSQKIRERLEAPQGAWPPLNIAPEGTTTNGSSVIKFRTGAFRPGVPVLPVAIEMPFSETWGYDPSFSCANMTLHIIGLMCRPWNRLIVHRLPVYVPSEAEKKDAHLYATNVRDRIAEAIGVPTYELQWHDKLQFEPSEKKRALGRKMSSEENGGALPAAPVFTQDVFGRDLATKTKVQ
ncbi:hypothetical protein ACHAXT_001818 [Thalassiosira profunda]